MEFAYVKLMEEHKLTYAQLPADAKTGIDVIKEMERMIALAEKKGKKIMPKTFDKLRINDRFVTREILDFLSDEDDIDDKDDKGGNPPPPAPLVPVVEVEKDLKEKQADPVGLKIEAELKALFEANKTAWKIDDLKEPAPETYACLFDIYKDGEENGIQTNLFMIVEKEDKLFHITKK